MDRGAVFGKRACCMPAEKEKKPRTSYCREKELGRGGLDGAERQEVNVGARRKFKLSQEMRSTGSGGKMNLKCRKNPEIKGSNIEAARKEK